MGVRAGEPVREPRHLDGLCAGGARKRWNTANFSIAVSASIAVTAWVSSASLGTVVYWQPEVSLRSVGKSSLVMPISTL